MKEERTTFSASSHNLGSSGTDEPRARLLVAGCDPEWLPDETLFSLGSRIHRLSCNALSRQTTLALFGHTRYGVEHDLTSNLAALATRSEDRWGTADELIDRTLLPFYLALQPPAAQLELRAMLHRPGIGHLKFRLGILTSRFRAHHPLKACPSCMDSDRRRFGTSYWHRAHQFPGVWLCLEHDTPLHESQVKATGVRRFDWVMPDEAELLQTITLSGPSETGRTTDLRRFAELALALVRYSVNGYLDPARLTDLYRDRALTLHGYRSFSSSTWDDLSTAYAASNLSLAKIPELAHLAHEPISAKAELQRLLRPPRSRTHPLRLLALIRWLYPDWGAFLEAYEAFESATSPPQRTESKQAATADVRAKETRAQLLMLIEEAGHSPSGAASIVGIDTATAMAWLAQTGIATRRRPKKLKAQLRASIIHELSSGADKRELAQRYALSISTITTLLRTEPGLHERWILARTAIAREQHREAWSALIRTHPATGIKAMRQTAPSSYAWLYRNDRAWLHQANTHVASARSGNNHQTDWAARDTRLSGQVQALACQLRSRSGRRLKQWQLTQALPELRAKLGQLHRLPLTRQALLAATSDPRTSDLFD